MSTRFIERGYPRKIIAEALGLHRSTLYRNKISSVDKAVGRNIVNEELARRIRLILDDEESFGYRRVWAHLRFKHRIFVNIKKVRRIMRIKGWQCKLWNRPGRKGPQVSVKRSVVDIPDRLWSTDLTRIYCGKDGWCSLIAVVDNGSREVTGYRFSKRGRAIEAVDALDESVISRYGSKEAVPDNLKLRSDNGSIFLASLFLKSTEYWNIGQEYIPGGHPEWNGVVERFFRTLKQECVWLHNFESFEQAETVVAQWIEKYNKYRLHSSLDYKTPEQWRKDFYELPQAA